MKEKLNQLGKSWQMFIWLPPVEGQGAWDNYLHINIPPNKYKELKVATKLGPVGSKVAGLLHVYKPGDNPDHPRGFPHIYWEVNNDQDYYYTSIGFPEPGTYSLVVRGIKNWGVSAPFTPESGDRWSGWVSVLAIEFISVDGQAVTIDNALQQGVAWTGEKNKVSSMPSPVLQSISQPSTQTQASVQSTSQPTQPQTSGESFSSTEQPTPQVVYVPIPNQATPQIQYVTIPEAQKKKGCFQRIGCWIAAGIILILFFILFLVLMGPALAGVLGL